MAFACLLILSSASLPVEGESGKLELLEAVASALSHHPMVASQQAQVDISRGAREIETGVFDPQLQSNLSEKLVASPPLITGLTAVGLGTDTVNQTAYSVGATKLYRDGVSVNPYYEISRTADSYYYPSGYNIGTAGVTVNVPLLRGRGSKVVAARERAAEMEVHAAQYDFDFLLASVAEAVAQDYWALVAAYRSVDVAVSAESRGLLYVQNTQALIDADHVPRSDLNQVRANLAQRTAARIAAQNSLVVARQHLSQAIGLTAEEIIQPLGDPADDFPTVPEAAALSNSETSLQQRLRQALTQRADYLAAVDRKKKVSILLPAAQNGLRPGLDLSVGGGYQSLVGGRAVGDLFASSVLGVRGPVVSAGLTYTYPVGNHAALGTLQQTQSSILQADVSAKELARDISQTMTVAVDNIRSSILRYEKTRLTVALAGEALTGARDKYRGGFGSVVEILQVEDQLNSALGDQVQARLDYALALTQYRFAVGTLVPTNQQVPVIHKAAFTEPISADQP